MKKLLTLALALIMCLTALPFAMAEGDVPVIDWYIGGADSPADLFALFRRVSAEELKKWAEEWL